jgi:hypothetical protein
MKWYRPQGAGEEVFKEGACSAPGPVRLSRTQEAGN